MSSNPNDKQELTMVQGLAAFERERRSQVEKGYDPDHDDEHVDGEIAAAAASYALTTVRKVHGHTGLRWVNPMHFWPWEPKELKTDLEHIKAIEVAGAMLLAEWERLKRATDPGNLDGIAATMAGIEHNEGLFAARAHAGGLKQIIACAICNSCGAPIEDAEIALDDEDRLIHLDCKNEGDCRDECA